MSWTTFRLYFPLDLPLSSHVLTRTSGLQGVYAMNVDTQPCSISATSTSTFSTPSAEAVSYIHQPIHICANSYSIGFKSAGKSLNTSLTQLDLIHMKEIISKASQRVCVSSAEEGCGESILCGLSRSQQLVHTYPDCLHFPSLSLPFYSH